MDREPEELQFLGIVGIYRESYKIIFSCRRIFTQIALSLVIPLAAIFLAHIEIADLLFFKISTNEEALERTKVGSPSEDRILDRLSSEWTAFFLFKALYLLLVLVLSLLSTSAVVYSIACLYTAKDLSFRKVLSVVPKVWRRLIVTFLWNFLILIAYNSVSFLAVVFVLFFVGPNRLGVALLTLLVLAYIFGLVYISVVWHLASVVSVLEDSYGIQAMQKSRALIRGKALVAGVIFLKLNLILMAINFLFSGLVVYDGSVGVLGRVALGILLFVALSKLILFGLVIQTVIYFVCKSYHHENVDKSCLSDHLEVYLGEYVPLKDRSVQMEQMYA